MADAAISLENVGAALAGLGALSTAAFGLLDSSKAFNGGVSNLGLAHIRTALSRFDKTLAAGIGPGWWATVRANWLNGVPKADQKAVVRALLKLGINPETASEIAGCCGVDAAELGKIAKALGDGGELNEKQLNVLGRVEAILDATLDAAFEQADQQYRNVSRLLAGVVAVALSVAAALIWQDQSPDTAPSLWVAFGVGLLAVPVAPVAKDLTSALSAAMKALKATRAV